MAYQTGQTTDPVDLLQKLVAFLQTNGWTVNASVATGSGHWKAHLSRDGIYVNLYATIGNGTGWNPWGYSVSSGVGATTGALQFYLSDGYSAGAAWNAQPGGPVEISASYKTGAGIELQSTGLGSYHFFAHDDLVAVVVEKTPGVWMNLGWCRLEKAGDYVGGLCFWGSSAPYYMYGGSDGPGHTISAYAPCANGDHHYGYASLAFVRADVDSFVDKWVSVGGNSTTGTYRANTGKFGVSSVYGYHTPPNTIAGNNGIVQRATSSLTGQITLQPSRLWVERDATPGGYSLLGTVPDCFEVRHGYTPGTVISLGADEYMLFPNFAIRRVM